MFLTLLAFSLAFALVPLEDYIGFKLTIEPASMVGIFMIALPMVLLASTIQMIVASFTRSLKEAQTKAMADLLPEPQGKTGSPKAALMAGDSTRRWR